MCGIVGLLRPGGGDQSALAGYAARMADALRHRGPDASGIWTNAASGVAFGHRRLSILDLSEAGAQPMQSECGRFTVTFNGEIYNHLDIRSELEAGGIGPNFEVGDVIVSPAVRFDCTSKFKSKPFAHADYAMIFRAFVAAFRLGGAASSIA